MIPKVIHYIWFGNNPLPEDSIRCINSWKKYCPDYEIKEWNESNFDINMCDYIKEAYAAKKWAFVSDYVRLSVLVDHGGIYMDTDVEVLKPLDDLLDLSAFSGFETEKTVPAGIMACEKGHPFFKKLLSEYDTLRFLDKDHNYDLTTNVTRITKRCIQNGLVLNNSRQTINGFTLFPKDYFCPINAETGKLEMTDNTYSIHWFAGSWKSTEEKKAHHKAITIKNKYPGFIGETASRLYEVLFKIKNTFKEGGLKALSKRIQRYIQKKKDLK